MPVMKRYWQSEPDGWGGVWKLNGNVLNIVREVGTQTRRLSLGGEWDRTFRDGIGGSKKCSPGRARGPYSVSDLGAQSQPDPPRARFSADRAPPVPPGARNRAAGRSSPPGPPHAGLS